MSSAVSTSFPFTKSRRIAAPPRTFMYHGALAVISLTVCIVFPPIIAFAPHVSPGLALCAVGTMASFAAGARVWRRLVRVAGSMLLWAVIAWCALSQVAPIIQPPARTLGWRLLPVSLGALVWCWLRFPLSWQRRTVIAMLLPTVLGLGIVGYASPTQMQNFSPAYLAVDSHGTLYVADDQARVVRYFSADGTNFGQMLPGVGGALGGKGSGMRPAGPLADPDQTGIATAVASTTGKPLVQEPWPRGSESFVFCGIAIGAHDRLYIPDFYNGKMLRFAPNGNLETRVDLPRDLHAFSASCITADSTAEYLAAADGSVYQLDLGGNVVAEWALPGPIAGGISVTPDGHWLYALGPGVLYRRDLRTHSVMLIPLPSQTSAGEVIYTRLVALPDGRAVLANVASLRLDIVCMTGRLCGTIGRSGGLPGQFSDTVPVLYPPSATTLPAFGNLAVGPTGEIYVSDTGHLAVQRFAPSGCVDAIYWSAYEYETI
jgi:hypothetical protein